MENFVDKMYPSLTEQVILREVGLRDGLQQVKSFPDTNSKIEWIDYGKQAGLQHFEVGSFLPVKRYPQFADVEYLIDKVALSKNLFSSVLVMNEQAITNAVQTAVNEFVCVISATEEHSQANMKRSRNASVDLIRTAYDLRSSSTSHKYVINAGIPMSFGCSISGAVAKKTVLRLVMSCLKAGADVITLADTVGFAGPLQIADLVSDVVNLCEKKPVAIHLHDTRGLGLANAAAALDNGIRVLDGSIGGLGGCPFAPGATGNVVMEDLVFLCERMGFRTGIDLSKLFKIRDILAREMPDEVLHGKLAKTKFPSNFYWKTLT